LQHRAVFQQLQLLHVQHDLCVRAQSRLGRKAVLDAASHHHLDKTAHVRLRDFGHAHILTVAQHRDAVAHLENFFEVVRDEDHCDALLLQLPHDREQMLGFGGRERGGRFVENQNARFERERLADLDKLLLRNGEFANRHGQVDRHAEPRENFRCRAPHLAALEQTETILHFAAEKHVLHRVQVRNQAEFLKHDADAGRHRVVIVREVARRAFDRDRAFVRLIDAAQNLHQRRFARAVFAEQRVNLAARDVQMNALQRLHAGKTFADVLELEYRVHRVLHRCPPPCRRP